MRKFINVACFLLLVANLAASETLAGNWFYQSMITTSLEGDDNKRLRVDEDEGVVGAEIRSNLRLSRVTEVSRINLDGIWRSSRFDGEPDDANLDTDDQEIRADGIWATERLQYSINAAFLRQNTALTELEDTGVFRDITRRVTRSVNPQAAYSISQKTSLNIGAGYTDVEFPGVIPASLSEFDTRFANFGINHILSETTQISLSYAYSIFESENIAQNTGNDIDTSSINFRIEQSWAEAWRVFAGIGFRKSKFSNDDGSGMTNRNDDTGSLFDTGLIRNFETGSLNLYANQRTEPSAIGTLNERTSLGLLANKRLSERLSVNLNFRWLENKSVDELNDSNDREFLSSTLKLDFQLTTNWFLTGEYRHREQKFDDSTSSADADSNAIIIRIRFAGLEKPL